MPRTAPNSSGFADSLPSVVSAIGADIIVLSPSDDELAAFATEWRDRRGSSIHPINIAMVAQRHGSDRQADQLIATAGAILITLPNGLAPWREAAEDIATIARNRRIAFAVIASNAAGELPSELATNLPPSTLRRLIRLYRQHGSNAARNILAQLSLAAGLSHDIDSDDRPQRNSHPPECASSTLILRDLIEDATR
ncbi:conserved hypothetical protein [Rhodopseudomonas palustris BisB5]|uniref:Cobaltochelatase subunit CobN n=1 Tax=Rhodopseudomonas palustris (strain BisB5) TaxID=316057 RepID=Q138D6_RHOPS|nr:conserved hypothetical protein [Rhodopseudomonas palustris BisB5]